MADLNATMEAMASLSANIDSFFLLLMGMLVFFMQCGFAFLEAGAVRSKNTTNILIKNVMDSFVSGAAYWILGFAFAYGDGGAANKFIGASYFASSNLPDSKYAEFFFQYTFAATAATIVSGAMAERCEFVAYFAYSFCITGFIYPVVTHWAWGGGWLSEGYEYDFGTVAYQDFAGSGVVHVLGGVAAFVGAALLGPRIGRFHEGQVAQLRGHSVPIAALGGFILFFGFLAFNGGSQLAISNAGDGEAVALSIVNTIISASFAAFGSLLINRIPGLGNSWSLLVTINGALTGMVSACAGCNRMFPWGACIMGVFASISYTLWSWLMKKIKIDDPLDAVAVHFGGGIWGVLGIAFLDREDGILLNWDQKSAYKLVWQLCGLGAIIGWTMFFSLLLFGTLKLFGLLRVPHEIEEKGLDIPKHNEPAYPPEAYGHGHVEHIMQVVQNKPTSVVQSYENKAFVNKAYQRRVSGSGPYEHPEIRALTKSGYTFNTTANGIRSNGSNISPIPETVQEEPEPEPEPVNNNDTPNSDRFFISQF
ncbi:putative ammonium transporter 1 isoform X2 [Pecten maximus]|uniref:putative ammonium transporter 1 isoform X2 n=1 Tax=Pecten maximus TaxID=6579 RepID=UPI0014584036|nr:putative ammonium transporter 1 isoform X2 [Pecten maximus]